MQPTPHPPHTHAPQALLAPGAPKARKLQGCAHMVAALAESQGWLVMETSLRANFQASAAELFEVWGVCLR